MGLRRVTGVLGRYRWLVAAVAALALLVGVLPLAVGGHSRPRPAAVLAPGSSGSLRHYAWWDPRGWFAGSGVPKPRVIAAVGGPETGRPEAQVAVPAPPRVRELTSRRDADTRVYQLADGRLQAVVSGVAVNYRDAAGAWQPIDTTVRPYDRAGFAFADVANSFRSFFGTSAGRLVRLEAPGGGWLEMGLDGGGAVRPVVAGSTVSYAGVAPGVGVSYAVSPSGLKEAVTLASASAAKSPLSYTLKVGGGLVAWQRGDGSVAFSREVGGPAVLVMPKPFMTDARRDVWSPYGYGWSPKVAQHVWWDAAAGVLRVTVTPDAGWLDQRGRVFPVVVDPTFVIAPTPTQAQNTFIEQDTPSSNYDSSWRLSVGTTSGGAVRSLLKFPLSAVPSGTQIDSADLRLYFDQDFGPGTSNQTIQADQATASWDASTATWSNASSNVGTEGLNEVVVDDSDAAHTTASGSWPSASNSAAQGGEYRYNQDTTSGDTFTWVPTLTEAGSYYVADHYVASTTAAPDAPFTVTYSGGSKAYTVNQQSGSGGVWAVLGQLPFVAGTAGKVVLGDGPATASVRVEADATRFRLWGENVFNPNNANIWHSFPVRNIVQSWLNGTANDGFVVRSSSESTLNLGGPRYEASRFAYQGEVATYPQLVITYGRPAVSLNQITTIHATGADLSWTAYTDPTPGSNPGDDLAEYQVHRSVFQSFDPSASTLVAPVAAGTTSFTDTTNTPTPPGGTGNAFYYMVAVKTQDGQVIAGPVRLVRLPTAGTTIKIINAAGDTTLSSAQPTTNEQQFAGQPWLGVGNNSTTYGVTRLVVNYPTMASAGIPSDATVTDAELKLWGWYNLNTGGGSATYDVHALTQSFDPTTATWNNASSTTAWTTAGGTYASTVTGSVNGLTNDPNREEWPVASTVQGWITTPSSEDGLLLRLHSESTSSGPQERELFLNSSAQETALRPELVVYYTEPTAADTYYSPSLPEPMSSATSYTVPVTLTNTTSSTWTAADYVLSYHWLLPDGTDVTTSADQTQTALAADMAPTSVATLNAAVTTPDTTGTGGDRTGYILAWDLYDKTTGTWLSSGTSTPTTTTARAVRLGAAPGATRLGAAPASAAGAASAADAAGSAASAAAVEPMASGNNQVPVLRQNASVEQPSSNLLGLEKFYQYTGVNTGAGSALLNNADAGNVVWSYNAFSNPSRGFATFVRMAYNSMDTSDSSMGFGWSLEASTVMRLGTPLDFLPNPNPTTVKLTDGDGTSHLYTYNSTSGVWQTPPGLHLYLQQAADCSPNGKDPAAKAWLLTRPDRTQFWFDCQGYQTAVVDRNGNEADFTYTQRQSNNKPVKFLSYITDPAGRQTLTLSYYAKGDNYSYIDSNGNVASGTNLTDPQIIDQVKSIKDISGRTITFLYDTEGLMAQMTDGDGSSLAKVFKFGYDMTQGNKNVKLVSVTDPRGHATSLAYYTAPQDPKFKWSLETITDRRGGATGFAYTEPGGGQIQTTVTDPNSHTSTYLMDSTGRPIQVTNALNQVTKLAWDGDNNVTSLTEDNGAVTTWTYDQNTGYPLTHTDALANKNGTASTTYTYQTGLSGHIADLISKLTPQQRLWDFTYDANGNLLTVTDPDGTATSTAGDFTTTYTYDSFGQLATAKDANGNTTTYTSYDPSGYPQTITDPLGNATKFAYDVRGNVTSVTDPLGHITTQAYDVFGRPGQKVEPKDQASGVHITTPAPVYDGNDNVTQATAPNGAVTSYSYDNNDKKVSATLPPDTSSSPQRVVTYAYDPAGNLTSTTEPNGNAVSPPSGFTTTYAYDAINELTSKTDAAAHTTSFAYDDVGNRTSVTDPLGHTTSQAFDLDHRPTVTTDPAGHTTSTAYDLDGLVTSTTDQNGNTTLLTLDARGKVTQVQVPHDTSGSSIVYDTTQYAYDQVGNRTMVVTPRGVAAGVTNTCTSNCAFTQQTQYDADNRVKAQLSAFDPSDPTYNTPAETDYSYDAAGRMSQVSAPPSGSQTVRNITQYGYFDNGWAKSSTDPWGIATSYDYNDLGEQASRTITSAGGDLSRSMTWGYFPDGKLQSRTDDGIPTGLYAELVDNSDVAETSSTGTWATSTSGSGFQGFNYQTHAAGTGIDAFTWNLNIPADGNYTVYVKYPAVSGAATNAAFKVTFSGGSATATVDQTKNAGTWVALGKWAFKQDQNGQQVTLAENSGGTVVADAVKAVRDNSADTNTNHHDFTYSYDPNGNLTAIADASQNTAITNYAITYDGINEVTKVEEQAGGTTQHTTTFGYDAAGNLTSRGHDAATSTYTYDPRNLLTKETDATSASDPSPQVTTFSYTPAGSLSQEIKPNGNILADTYFADNLLQNSTENTSGGTLVASHSYTYNPDGGKTQDVAKLMSADNNSTDLSHTFAYTYDPRDRITQVTKDGTTTESYVHDANDNVTSQTVNGTSTTFSYDRNRLVTATTGSATLDYNYDPFGRLDTVTAGSQVNSSDTYDGFDHIISHQQQNSSGGMDTTTYTYDPLDRKTSQTTLAGTSSAKTTDYAYLGLSNDLITESSGGSVTKSYTYTPAHMRLSQTTHNSDGTTTAGYYTYNDHNDVVAVTGQSGTTTATYGYTAYGQDDTTQFTGADKPANQQPNSQPFNAYRFNAMRWDSSTSQYDMGFRTYDASLNQFLSRDMYDGALADTGLDTDPFTGNRYTFGAGNPISNIELDGHMLVGSGGSPSPCILCNSLLPKTGTPGITPGCANLMLTCIGTGIFGGMFGTGSSSSGTAGTIALPQPAPRGIPGELGGIFKGLFTLAALGLAAAEAARFFKERRSQDCLSGGQKWDDYGPLDTENGTLNPGRATAAMACITPASADPGGRPRPLPGYDPTKMNLSHLLAAEFNGTAAGKNIVLLWEWANQGFGLDPATGFSQMRQVEQQIETAKEQGKNTLYYAQAIYSPLQGTGPGGTPYMPIGIFIKYQIAGQDPRYAYVQNVP